MPLHTRYRHLLTLGLLLGSLSLGACADNDFEQFYEITKLRILGIAAEPAGVAPGETVVFEAVTAKPDDAAETFYRWQICVLTDGPDHYYRCSDRPLFAGPEGDAPAPAGLSNVLAEGAGPRWSFTQDQATNEQLLDACEFLARADSYDLPDFVELPACKSGFPVHVRVEACQGRMPPCDDPEIALHRFTLLLDEAAARSDRNQNPAILGLLAENDPVSDDDRPTIAAQADGSVRLTALVPTNEAQRYTPVERFDPATRSIVYAPEAEQEILNLSWFSTAGELDRNGYYSADGRAPIEELQTNVLSFDIDTFDEPVDVHLWLVLRDDRRGLSYLERRFRVTPPASE